LRTVLFILFVFILSLYLVYVLALFFAQRYMLYPGRFLKTGNPAFGNYFNPDIHWLITSSGKTEIWYLAASESTANGFTILFAHGNNELIDDCKEEAVLFSKYGFNVLFAEYPGFGRSEGKPSQESITETLILSFDWLTEYKGISPERIILYGRSLGGGAVCALSLRRPAGAMILQSTFTSVRKIAARYFVPTWLVSDPFDNLAAVMKFQKPILIFHGTGDDLIPYDDGVKLAESAPQARLVPYHRGHNDLPPDWEHHLDIIRNFVNELPGPNQQ